jgi:ABC-type polysaccharide/polyol phosphate transport system ATPase subunit
MSLLTESNFSTKSSPIAPDQDDVIRLENVSVVYRVPHERINTFKEYAIRWIQGKVKHQVFWALKDVDLTIKKGEIFGVVGQNGAGKSTLLKLVARVLCPTKGRVWVKGHVAPLLELGAGFHPELTGRENVILNGAMLGFSRREMEEKFTQIVDFAELWDFIDAPIRTYSSGMTARLGFSVATDVNPTVLLIDEILAVGDEAFQRKCIARIQSFQEKGLTILLVSHHMGTILEMCQRAAYLSHGRVEAIGDVAQVIKAYRQDQPG